MNEAEIARGLKNRNPEAIEEVTRQFGDRLLRSAYVLLGNDSEAQDLVHETLIQAIISAGKFRAESGLYTWLTGIMLNLSRHYHRKRKRMVYMDEVPREKSVEPAQLEAFERQQAGNALMVAIRQLTQAHREVIMLRYFEGLKIDEMARRMKVSTGTVKSRLHYATEQLKKKMPKDLNLFRP